ncbi:MAG TPA: fructosamine kinase family protein [Thiobacillus sp.]|nr:fructosamine kinase family protein [Thiobacillus sp.]
MSLQDAIARAITQATGEVFRPEGRRGVSGGDINTAEMLEGGGRRYFVKLNDVTRLAMFEAESEGLAEITNSKSVHVPQPICLGTHDSQAFLVLEYLDIGPSAGKTEELLGHQLAAMHRSTTTGFGWRRDNTIGSTPQINTAEQNWVTFYREHRLRFQLELAARNNPGGNFLRRGEQLLEKLPAFFANYQPSPSLLHGDLWGGNHAALRDGTPVVFDPAVYYGDRETDIAMTELFGGYSTGFYAAYNETWPLDAGYRARKNLYNLYHVLNHFNLFGGGYGSQGERIIEMLLSEA